MKNETGAAASAAASRDANVKTIMKSRSAAEAAAPISFFISFFLFDFIIPHPSCVGLLDLSPVPPPPSARRWATSALGAGRPLASGLVTGFFENFARSRKSERRSKKRNKESTLFERLLGFEFLETNFPRFARKSKKFSPRFARTKRFHYFRSSG